MISPLDVVPDAIPIVGFTDDLGVLIYVLKKVWGNVEPEIQDKARERLSKWFDEDEIAEIGDLRRLATMKSVARTDTAFAVMVKFNNANILLYRTATVYLRLAEALNRIRQLQW